VPDDQSPQPSNRETAAQETRKAAELQIPEGQGFFASPEPAGGSRPEGVHPASAAPQSPPQVSEPVD
jgi:hypothetical protein